MKKRTENPALGLIQSNIAKFGHHVYLVSGGPLPRFAYTIGASATLGTEIILAGASFYSAEDVTYIINAVAANLQGQSAWSTLNLHVDSLGSFSLRKVDATWGSALMLGALDFYRASEIPAVQIVPDREHWTVDIPDLT